MSLTAKGELAGAVPFLGGAGPLFYVPDKTSRQQNGSTEMSAQERTYVSAASANGIASHRQRDLGYFRRLSELF